MSNVCVCIVRRKKILGVCGCVSAMIACCDIAQREDRRVGISGPERGGEGRRTHKFTPPYKHRFIYAGPKKKYASCPPIYP